MPALDRAELARYLPHRGSMLLLERVVAWDDTRIRCQASSHADPAHPLRAGGRLGAAGAVEYAAQAMAAHAALRGGAGERVRPGMIAAVRDLQLAVARLDDLTGPLVIEAEQLLADDHRALYRFAVSGAGQLLAAGRVSLVLEAA